MVSVNGVNTPKGRFPNPDANNGGYLTIDNHVSNTSVEDADMPSSSLDWTGAEIVMKVYHWVFNRAPITSHLGTTINYTSSISSAAQNGYGYFIQQDNKVLDKLGEWTFLKGKLYMYFGTVNPESYSVNVSVLDKLLYLSSKNYINISNIEFIGSNLNAIHLTSTANINISNCNINFSGFNGIQLDYSTRIIISNCLLNETQNNAINTGPYLQSCSYITLSHNNINNTYMWPGMSSSGDGKGFSISLMGDNSLAEYNQITN